jgi:two-component system CheB/CheR fusion protein
LGYVDGAAWCKPTDCGALIDNRIGSYMSNDSDNADAPKSSGADARNTDTGSADTRNVDTGNLSGGIANSGDTGGGDGSSHTGAAQEDAGDLVMQEMEDRETGDEFLIVGLGASAGGIRALKEFFSRVPADSDMAYVVILHLSPDHESQLAEVLQSTAAIPVTQVQKRTKVERNHVYVVSPNHSLQMKGGHLGVSDLTRFEERRAPVDLFFRTLGESQHSRAVCVVLSGTGANGSMGLKRIKECGGFCIAQDPREAEHSDMPSNSIATGLVDQVLPVLEIPARIIAYKNHLATTTIPAETQPHSETDDRALTDIFTQLRTRTGHDFTNYKRTTVLRRIARRITVHGLQDLPAYAEYLRQDRDEARALLKDLLISVTNFFRDEGPFRALKEKIIPKLFEDKGPEYQVRVWVVACATGEEAYSLAMLLSEFAEGCVDAPSIQVFATDIDEWAIAKAREGFYTLNDAADVSPERLRRYFTKEGAVYRVRRELREMVLFAVHNLIKDPPFSHLDMISCRNLLIYLNRPAQERVLQLLHFALNPQGYLFLGASESIEGAGSLFASVDKDNHLVQSRPVEARLPVPIPDLSFTRQQVFHPDARPAEARAQERLTYLDLHQRLLEQYAAPSVVINEDYDIVHVSERAGRYMRVGGGEPSLNLLKLIRPELRLELRTALYQAARKRQQVDAQGLELQMDGGEERVNISVRPVLREDDPTRGFILVLFDEAREEAAKAATSMVTRAGPIARQLEDELIRVRAQLRATGEQHEVQQEELKASNEELQAINEELRSSAEELETSKEELQSVNEELITVNQELKIKIEEVTQTNNDILNLVNSTDIGTIFLDREMRVKLFTPAACGIFNLIEGDKGRPLSDITHKLKDGDLIPEVERVIERMQSIVREVGTSEGGWYLMRIAPYRTSEDRIDGAVLTFTDIGERMRSGQLLRAARYELEQNVEQSRADLADSNASRAEVVRQLVGAQEIERRRMATDLHDQLGQQLTALRLNVEILKGRLVEDAKAFEQLEQVQTIARRIESEVDFLAWGLRPLALDDLGLAAAIEDYLQRWEHHTGIAADFHSTGLENVRLTAEIEINLYRILQEALNNVQRHAHSERVEVLLERREHEVVLVIEDAGVGGVNLPKGRLRGMGLVSMRERAALMGGTFEIESEPERGTALFARVPAVFAPAEGEGHTEGEGDSEGTDEAER